MKASTVYNILQNVIAYDILRTNSKNDESVIRKFLGLDGNHPVHISGGWESWLQVELINRIHKYYQDSKDSISFTRENLYPDYHTTENKLEKYDLALAAKDKWDFFLELKTQRGKEDSSFWALHINDLQKAHAIHTDYTKKKYNHTILAAVVFRAADLEGGLSMVNKSLTELGYPNKNFNINIKSEVGGLAFDGKWVSEPLEKLMINKSWIENLKSNYLIAAIWTEFSFFS